MKVDSVPNGAMCEGEKEDASSQKEGAEVQEPPKKEEEAPTTKEDETVEMVRGLPSNQLSYLIILVSP